MKIAFFIREKKGQKGIGMIYVSCFADGVRLRISTKMELPVDLWDSRRERPVIQYRKYREVTERMLKFEECIRNAWEDLCITGDKTSLSLLKASVEARMFGLNNGLVCPYYKRWAETPEPGRTIHRGLMMSYRLFREYAGEDTTFSMVNHKFINGFITFMNKRNLSLNYIGTQIKCLKAVMNKAYKEGLHDNLDYKEFKKMSEPSDSVYLTSEEITRIKKISLRYSAEKLARDLFLIGYYTSMRFSDYSRLSLADIDNGIIKICTKKTGETVYIPAHPELLRILNEYGGRAPKIEQQVFNRYIKIVCAKAGIDEMISKTITKGGRKITEYHPKYELVSSHTARRSGATNMYKSGIDKHSIMMITGHRTEAVFNEYIRVGKEENAQRLAGSKFFTE